MKISFKKLNVRLLLLNLFFLQAYLIRFSIGNYPSNLQEALIGLNLLAFILALITEKKLAETIGKIFKHRVIITFIALTGISLLLIEPREYLDMIRYLKFLFFAIVLSFIFLETFTSDHERKIGIKIAGLGAIAFGIFSLIYNLSGFNVTNDYRLLGPLDAAVYLAYYFVPFFIFFTIQFLETRKRSYLYYAIILAILILGTRSAGAIGGTFLVTCVYLFKFHGEQILKKNLIKISIAILLVIILGATFYFKILPAIQTNYSSLNERGEIWKTSIYLLGEPKNLVLGLGVGQFQYEYSHNVDLAIGHRPLDYIVLQPHNIFMIFIFQYGLLGLIFILFCFYKTTKTIVNYHEEKLDIKTLAAFIFLYFFIHGFIDTPFFKNDLLFLLILFMEMAFSTRNNPHKRD